MLQYSLILNTAYQLWFHGGKQLHASINEPTVSRTCCWRWTAQPSLSERSVKIPAQPPGSAQNSSFTDTSAVRQRSVRLVPDWRRRDTDNAALLPWRPVWLCILMDFFTFALPLNYSLAPPEKRPCCGFATFPVSVQQQGTSQWELTTFHTSSPWSSIQEKRLRNVRRPQINLNVPLYGGKGWT